MRRKLITTVWSLLMAAAVSCAVTPTEGAEKKPNIIVMLTDNLG